MLTYQKAQSAAKMFFHKFLTSSCSELLLKFSPVSIVKLLYEYNSDLYTFL